MIPENRKQKLMAIASTLPETKNLSAAPSLEEAVDHIDQMDFRLLKKKICKKDPLISRVWTLQEAEIGIQLYKNFLFLNKKYSEEKYILPPSIEIDEIWHHHIMDTRQYFIDSLSIFGSYFHHYPYFGIRGDEDLSNMEFTYDDTQRLHVKEFGCRIPRVWS